MLASVSTVAFVGVCTIDVSVQVHISNGIPAFHIVGMPDKVVAESRERIRAALSSVNAVLPSKRITVNLSPANLYKEGSHYDLPIATAILAVMRVIKNVQKLSTYIILGELSLDGSIVAVSGILAASASARKIGKGIISPYCNAKEASLIGGIDVVSPKHLTTLIDFLNDNENSLDSDEIVHFHATDTGIAKFDSEDSSPIIPNMRDVKGQVIAKRASEIAAAGRHNLLMIGPPGTGKSMIAKRIPGILPDLSVEEIISVNVIHSITGGGVERLSTSRPFREPHSSASMVAMIGGGIRATPGEITMAHNGILFLDELPEFSRSVLESLRQPLEDKKVVISRAHAHVTYPANFQLIAAMNPCKCGYLHNARKRCVRAPKCATEYIQRISGPIMSRIDIKVEVNAVSEFSTLMNCENQSSESIKTRVMQARLLQDSRYGGRDKSNAALSANDMENFVLSALNEGAKKLFEYTLKEGNLSGRDSSKILKVSRTISDLSSSTTITEEHLKEAICFFQGVIA
ncbi:YifB family Mg chelatase-like AAA ATPase [Anaplasma bovis]|uniref:YifB family Mg chelatase-like AAA ATPase n=1 Tax=Anaplasma bovis TaxID=186733 RepID=UPI002FF05FF5